MDVATSAQHVGVRELKNRLSHYLAAVRDGSEVVVTDRGRPVARLVAVDAADERLADLVEAGWVRPAPSRARQRPRRIQGAGPVSDLVADQRR